MGTRAALPDLEAMDAAELRRLVRAQHEREGTREAEIERLTLLLAKLQRMLFGRRSERVVRQIEQLELQLEELQSEPRPWTWSPAAAEAATPAEKPRRAPLPDHLPREIRCLEAGGAGCPSCGGELRRIGEDVSEVLDIVPARLRAIRYVRPKYACRGCERLVQAPAAARPIARGEATPALLAHVLVSKYGDHLPLYRQETILQRSGVELARSTLCGWVRECRDLLAPLSEALRQYVMAGGKGHADDTPVPVLAPGTGKTRTAGMWAYVRDDRPAGSSAAPAAWFGYSPDRKGEHPARHLGSFRGILQADGYAGFHAIYERGQAR